MDSTQIPIRLFLVKNLLELLYIYLNESIFRVAKDYWDHGQTWLVGAASGDYLRNTSLLITEATMHDERVVFVV